MGWHGLEMGRTWCSKIFSCRSFVKALNFESLYRQISLFSFVYRYC